MPDRTSTPTDLPVSDLDTTLADKIRCKRDPATIERYAAILATLPPIEVYQIGERLLVTDGAHRVAAAQEINQPTLPAILRTGRTERDAWLAAITANQNHGLPLKAADRRKILSLLLDDGSMRRRSDRWLADLVGCSPTTVGDLRREREQIGAIPAEETRTTRDGSQIHVPTPEAPATVGDPVRPTDAHLSITDATRQMAAAAQVLPCGTCPQEVDSPLDHGRVGESSTASDEDLFGKEPPPLPGDTSRLHAQTRAYRALIAEHLRTGAACTAPPAALLALALRWGLTASTRCHDLCRHVLRHQGMANGQGDEIQHTFASAVAWSVADALESPAVATSDLIDLDQIATWWGADPQTLQIHAARSLA